MENNLDEIDVLLFDYFEHNREVPDIISRGIDSALKSKNINVNIFAIIKRFIITILGLISLVGGVVFAKDIANYIYHFFDHNVGIDTAIENGYIETPEMEYVNSSNIETKIENILMDDYNLSFTILIKFDAIENVSEINQIRLPNLLISDNEKNILYCEDEETFNKYCEENKLKYKYLDFNDNYINSGSNWYIKSKNIEENTVELIYNLYGKVFPKSKKLDIAFSKINIGDLPNDDKTENKCIEGKWKINLDVPEEFYNREALVYRVKSCSDETIKVTEAVVYNTSMKFQLETQENPVYLPTDSEEMKRQKVSEWRQKYKEDVANNDFSNIHIFGYEPYVETEDNKRYYPAESSSEDSGFSRPYTGNITYWQTFTLTKYDATDTLKVFINYKQKDIQIGLERVK